MNKTRLLVSFVVAIVAIAVALRYRTLQQLKTEQTQLRQQIEEAKELRAAVAQKEIASPASTNTVLSTTEHLELLRLRNEISQLRRESVAESNQMTIQMAQMGDRPVPASAYTPVEGVATREQQVISRSRGKDWALALIRYADANGDQFPATLADAAKFAPKAEGADDFELVVTGKLSAIKFPSRTIVLREKQPWKSSDGKWGRVYAFADGHMITRLSDTEDFAEWERQLMQENPTPTQ